MTGETGTRESGWTTDTLHAHLTGQIGDLKELLDERYATQTKALDAAFVAAEKAVQTALESADKAVSKTEASSDKRFESVNEFRSQLADQQKTLLTRQEYDTAHDNLVERVGELRDRINKAEGKGQGMNALFGWGIAAVSIAIAAASLLIPLSR